MRKNIFFAFLLLLLCACGVKAPPVAPQRAADPPVLLLDCDPKDPECDKTDPNYRPQNP